MQNSCGLRKTFYYLNLHLVCRWYSRTSLVLENRVLAVEYQCYFPRAHILDGANIFSLSDGFLQIHLLPCKTVLSYSFLELNKMVGWLMLLLSGLYMCTRKVHYLCLRDHHCLPLFILCFCTLQLCHSNSILEERA